MRNYYLCSKEFLMNLKLNKQKRRQIAFAELLGLTFIYVIVVWILIPKVLISSSSLVIMLFFDVFTIIYFFFLSPNFIHFDTLSQRGLGTIKTFYIRTDNFIDVFKSLQIMFVFGIIIIVLAAWYNKSVFFIDPNWYALVLKFIFYLISALFQELLFFSFIFLRIKELVNIKPENLNKITVLIIFATTFMLVHLPNIPVMILSFSFALFSGYIFYRNPNIHAIVIVHATLGTLLYIVYKLYMKIGPFYGGESEHLKGYLIRYLIPHLNDLLSNLW